MGVLCELLVMFLGEFEVLLVDMVHVGILLFGLDMAAVACIKSELQMSRKE
jgi:hypothetical protein